MPNDLIANDPIVARNFYLELDDLKLLLSGVSGFDIELEFTVLEQNGPNGKQQHIKTLGGTLKAPDITVTRMAPIDVKKDKLWDWFHQIRDGGFKASDRAQNRKNGSIVMLDSYGTELARFNFYNGWPTKIVTSELKTDSNEPLTETITFVCEQIDRIK